MRFLAQAVAGTLAFTRCVWGLEFVLNNTESTKNAASNIAYGMVSYYHGNESGQVPGMLPPPYYWWECGAMMNTLINYWYYTGDDTYNDIVKEGLLFQTGPEYDYLPLNESKNEGNDDQAFWGFAVMAAAELNFDNPPADQPQWLGLAQNVFDQQSGRWDTTACNGGLRWQIYTWNKGYDYKNSAANGGLFNIASRLYAYTGNQSFADVAERQYDWMTGVGLISEKYEVFDGTQMADNCTSKDHTRWTYNQGIMLHGAAVMWNATNSTKWQERVQGLWNASSIFFNPEGVMFEVCEIPGSIACNLDQQSFKAYLSRFMAASAKVAPWLYDQVMPLLYTSSVAAAAQCDGGTGDQCGMKWTQNSTYDGFTGVGQQMAALEVIQSTLIQAAVAPVTADTGGTSTNTTGPGGAAVLPPKAITTSDKAGAGILTAVLVIGALSLSYWLVST